MPSKTLQPGRKRRNGAIKGIAGATSPVTRKTSLMSQTSVSEATTKSLSSNTDFSLPSPPGASGKPKLKGSGNRQQYHDLTDEPPNVLAVIYDAGEHSESATSCGSLTLGGAASLSSTDTFQNSSTRSRSSSKSTGTILKRRVVDTRTDQSQDTLPHSNTGRSSGKGYLPHSIQQYHNNGHSHQTTRLDEDWSSSSSSMEVDLIPIQPPVNKTRRRSTSIETDPSNTSSSPKKKTTAVTAQSIASNSKKSTSKSSPQKKSTLKIQQARSPDSSSPKKHKPRRSSAKSSIVTNDRSFGARNGSWGDAIIDLSSWQSDDDGDSSTKEDSLKDSKTDPEPVINNNNKKKKKRAITSNWKSPLLFEQKYDEEETVPAFLKPQMTTHDGKPRSAYDKNADWYCDSEDEKGSVTSDSSSVLSAFRKKPVTETKVVPQSEASMDFGALLGGAEGGSSEALEADQSMTFDNLRPSQGQNGFAAITELIPDLREESMQSDIENMLDQSALELLDNSGAKASDVVAMKSASTKVSEAETCSPPESVPSILSSPASSHNEVMQENKRSRMKTLTSKRVFRWVLAGVMLMLILDVILLSIFLARRGSDSSTGAKVLAYVPETVCLDWIPSGGKSKLCTPAETALGGGVPNLLAHAILSSSNLAVDSALALIPGGVAYRDIAKGNFTEEDAAAVFEPNDSLRRHLSSSETPLVSGHATGSEIRRLLSENVAAALGQGKEYMYPYAAGLRFSVHSLGPDIQIGGIEVEVGDNWYTLNEQQQYVVVTTKDWAHGYFKTLPTALESTPLSALIDYAVGVDALLIPAFSTKKVVESSQIDSGKTEDGTILVPRTICLDWLPGAGISIFCSKEDTSKLGGGVGNVVAWSVLEYLNSETEYENDMFLLHAGQCQTDIAEGSFSDDDAEALLPVDQAIVLLNVTGLQLMNSLEQAIDFSLMSLQNVGSYPYAGGVRYEVFASSPVGYRLSNVEFFTRGRWKAVTPERQYRLATTLTLADGMLGYDALFDALSRVDPSDLTLRDSFVKFAELKGMIEDVPLAKYSTQTFAVT